MATVWPTLSYSSLKENAVLWLPGRGPCSAAIVSCFSTIVFRYSDIDVESNSVDFGNFECGAGY